MKKTQIMSWSHSLRAKVTKVSPMTTMTTMTTMKTKKTPDLQEVSEDSESGPNNEGADKTFDSVTELQMKKIAKQC